MNTIHPTAVIDPNVILGENNFIGPFSYITGETVIGDDNWFGSHTSIGVPADHRDYLNNNKIFNEIGTGVLIGNRNVFRENTVVCQPTTKITSIDSDCYIMEGAHVAHDCTVENSVTLAAGVKLAGNVKIETHANMGMNASVKQGVTVGCLSMVGMGAVIVEHVVPFSVTVGIPGVFKKWNSIGLKRLGYDVTEIFNVTADMKFTENKVDTSDFTFLEKYWHRYQMRIIH